MKENGETEYENDGNEKEDIEIGIFKYADEYN
jgi:hypothetical protein